MFSHGNSSMRGRLQPIVSTRHSRVRRGPQSLRQRRGYVQHEESLCRIRVVFAALVNHTKVPMSCGLLVSYHGIQLPGFERGRIPRIVNADSEFCSSSWFVSHASIQQREFQFEFLPSDPVRLVPMDLCCMDRTMPEAYFGNARNFLHRPLPYIRCNRLRTRIRRPTAMGSIAVISPIISKSMRPQRRRSALGPNWVYSIHQRRCMRPPMSASLFAVGGRLAVPSFRIHPAERRVGQIVPAKSGARHLVIAFTRSNGAGGCVTRRWPRSVRLGN